MFQLKSFLQNDPAQWPGKIMTSTSKLAIIYIESCNNLAISNMVLFDHNGKIKKYNNINEILEEYYE